MDYSSAIVLGLGKTGLSFTRFLQRQGVRQFTVMDTRAQPPGIDIFTRECPDAELITGPFDMALLRQATVILASPGVDQGLLKQLPDTVLCIGDVELFAQQAQAPILAVTGSNGKSTVVTLLAAMIAADDKEVIVAGNIGVPVLDVLAQPVPDYYVLELSSFQLTLVEHLNAEVAVILNLSEDHLDQHGTMEAYRKAKQRIYQQTRRAVINADQITCWYGVVDEKTAVAFSMQQHLARGWCLDDGNVCCDAAAVMSITECLLQAPHQLQNALAACAMAASVGVSIAAMQHTLKTFSGLAHRCEVVATDDQIAWINDSKATNVGSTVAALQSFLAVTQGPLFWIAGGQGKGQDFSPLAAFASDIAACYLIGADAALIADVIPNAVIVDSLERAVEEIKTQAKAGDVVLFSPACASFDMFDNFEHRGDCFKVLVHG